MKFKRAILTGILLWVLIFFEVSILMFGIGLEGTTYYIFHYIILIILVSIASLIYFKDKKIKPSAKEGFLLGIIYIITGIILDAIITIPLFIKDYSFLADIYLWIGLIEGLIIATVIGAIKKT